jgi:N-acetyl sugar amidotransferase
MKYCQRCLYPENHPLGILFDEEGICTGCRVHEEKDTLDWPSRLEKLRNLVGTYRSETRRNYDCIVPVSGARDSYFIVDTVKNKLGLNPLLVTYNRHWNTNRGHRNYAYLKTIFDCDAMEMLVDPAKVKRITRYTLEKIGSMYWHVLAGSTVFPVQIAVRFNIPLIIWGAHQGLDQVGMYSHTDEVEMTRKYRKEHDLLGYEAEALVDPAAGISEQDVLPYVYPHDKEIEKTGVRGIYLGNYIRWDSKAQHEEMIARYGYESAPQQRTFDTYNDVNCHHYSGTHDYIKFLKWGYGKITDHASREIRLKRLTREEGIALVQRYQEVEPKDLDLLLNWLKISRQEFFTAIDRFRDPRAWARDGDGAWTLRDSVVEHLRDPGVEKARLNRRGECHFEITPNRNPHANEQEYQLLHKGYVH